MKITFLHRRTLLVNCLIIFLFACEGPSGKDGIAGKDGLNGKDGANGLNGNYNVKTQTLSVVSTDWTVDPNSKASSYTANATNLTELIANNGLVLVYFKNSGSSIWTPLPYSISNATFTESWRYTYEPFKVYLKIQTSDQYAYKPNCQIRIVTATADGRKAPVNWDDYNDVVDFFGLSEG